MDTQPVILAALYERQRISFWYDAVYFLESLHNRHSCSSRYSTVNRSKGLVALSALLYLLQDWRAAAAPFFGSSL